MKDEDCICHETVVGKDECPVHGKPFDRSPLTSLVEERLPKGWRCQYDRKSDTFFLWEEASQENRQPIKGAAVQTAVEKGLESLKALIRRAMDQRVRVVPMEARRPPRPLSERKKPKTEEESRG